MNSEFILAVRELAKEKGVSEDMLFEAVEAAIHSAYKKNFGAGQAVRVVLDRDSGALKVYSRKEVASIVLDKNNQIVKNYLMSDLDKIVLKDGERINIFRHEGCPKYNE